MSNPVTSATQTQPAAQSTAVSPKPSQPKPQPTIVTDTVQLSNVAQVALQEAIETSAQTTKEANAGDIQARKLLAKESAAAQTAKK
jgi:hypothetical protein